MPGLRRSVCRRQAVLTNRAMRLRSTFSAASIRRVVVMVSPSTSIAKDSFQIRTIDPRHRRGHRSPLPLIPLLPLLTDNGSNSPNCSTYENAKWSKRKREMAALSGQNALCVCCWSGDRHHRFVSAGELAGKTPIEHYAIGPPH